MDSVVFRVVLGRGIVVSEAQPGSQELTRRKMELSSYRTIADPYFKAGVTIAKGYRGCHDHSGSGIHLLLGGGDARHASC
jgi:hypothetical protein